MNGPTGPQGARIPFARIGEHPPPNSELRGFPLSARPVLALDLGGTHIRAAVVTDGRHPACRGPGTHADRRWARRRSWTPARLPLRKVRGQVGMGGARMPSWGIGYPLPGRSTRGAGVVLETPNMGPRFVDVPIASELGGRLGLPAFLERDTNVAALGRWHSGRARDCPDFIYLTVSTGVGGRHRLRGPDLPWSGRNGRRTRHTLWQWMACAPAARSATSEGIVSGAGNGSNRRAIVAWRAEAPSSAARVAQKGRPRHRGP